MCMKRIFIFNFILLLSGMTIFAQSPNMSFFTEEFSRSGATVSELQDILQVVRDQNLTGIGDFYYNAISVFIRRLPDFSGNQDRVHVEETARLLMRGLAAEKHTAAAPEIWFLLQYFDIASPQNDGYLMYEAFVAMGQVNAKSHAARIAVYLDSYNARSTTNEQIRTQIHRVAPGAINALEALCEPPEGIGMKQVLIASAGWYESNVRNIASDSLIKMMEALGEVIGDIVNVIMRDPLNSITIKNTCWQELLRSRAPDTAKARVAAVALEQSYSFFTATFETQSAIREMRRTAIETIRVLGVTDDSVYTNLQRTYREAFVTTGTDFAEIERVVRALSAVKTDKAVDLLTEFLQGIHSRRRSGPWGAIERNIMRVLIEAIATTGTQSQNAHAILSLIQGSSNYTGAEQGWARSALTALNSTR